MSKAPTELSPQRRAVLEKIALLEREGRFDEDVEEDPPGRVLRPEDIEYVDRGFWEGCKRAMAYAGAYLLFWVMEMRKDVIVHPAQGLEHLAGVKGAVITCNHFSPMDSFLMTRVFDASKRPGRMYRVIREGNYTSFPGFFGFMMRHCDTMPLSSDLRTMKKFLRGVERVLSEGNCLLIYPEQSMWWNYRKPKPLKSGAFDIAVKNGVPVVPCFITMADTQKLDADGYPVQEYTPHVGAPIYVPEGMGKRQAREYLRTQVEKFNHDTYTRVYGKPATYGTDT